MKSLKNTSIQTPGLSPVHQANTAEEMAILLTPLISKRFTLSKTVTKKLKVANDSFLSMMTEYSRWVVPESFAAKNQTLEQLTVPFLLLLKNYPLTLYS